MRIALATRLHKTPEEVDDISMEDAHHLLEFFMWEAEQQKEAYKEAGNRKPVARGVTATQTKTTTRLVKRDNESPPGK